MPIWLEEWALRKVDHEKSLNLRILLFQSTLLCPSPSPHPIPQTPTRSRHSECDTVSYSSSPLGRSACNLPLLLAQLSTIPKLHLREDDPSVGVLLRVNRRGRTRLAPSRRLRCGRCQGEGCERMLRRRWRTRKRGRARRRVPFKVDEDRLC